MAKNEEPKTKGFLDFLHRGSRSGKAGNNKTISQYCDADIEAVIKAVVILKNEQKRSEERQKEAVSSLKGEVLGLRNMIARKNRKLAEMSSRIRRLEDAVQLQEDAGLSLQHLIKQAKENSCKPNPVAGPVQRSNSALPDPTRDRRQMEGRRIPATSTQLGRLTAKSLPGPSPDWCQQVDKSPLGEKKKRDLTTDESATSDVDDIGWMKKKGPTRKTRSEREVSSSSDQIPEATDDANGMSDDGTTADNVFSDSNDNPTADGRQPGDDVFESQESSIASDDENLTVVPNSSLDRSARGKIAFTTTGNNQLHHSQKNPTLFQSGRFRVQSVSDNIGKDGTLQLRSYSVGTASEVNRIRSRRPSRP